MSKLTIKTTSKGKDIYIDDKKIEGTYFYSVSEEVGQPLKATISFYPTEIDLDIDNK